MSKTDKKAISILLIIFMVLTIMNPVIVMATDEIPEGNIEFQDANLKRDIISSVDTNKDGYITQEEMEAVTALTVSNSTYYNISSLEDLKYAVNLEILSITSYDAETLDLTPFTKLKTFSLSFKTAGKTITAENVQAPENLFLYTTIGSTNIYSLKGHIVEDLTIFENERYGKYLEQVEVEDTTIAKVSIEGYTYNTVTCVTGIKAGTTTMKFESEFGTKESTLTVIESTINSNPELEDSGVTSELIYNRVLMSNGTLWKINSSKGTQTSISSESTAEIEDTNVKEFSYAYDRGANASYYLTLKKDGKLSIKTSEWIHEENIIDTMEISNVKQLADLGRYHLGYLTNDNDVYYIDTTESITEITPKLIEQNIDRVEGAFYIKNGATYFWDGTKVSDSEIDSAYQQLFSIGNDLYVYYTEYSDTIEVVHLDSEFKEFSNDIVIYGMVRYITTDDTLKLYDGYTYVGEIEEDSNLFTLTVGTIDFKFYLANNNTFYVTDKLELLTNVENGLFTDYGFILVRSDGSVWFHDYSAETDSIRLISPSDCGEILEDGDVDGSGEVNIKDVKLTLQYALDKTELSEVQIKAADVNEDGSVDVKDVKLILQYALGKIENL